MWKKTNRKQLSQSWNHLQRIHCLVLISCWNRLPANGKKINKQQWLCAKTLFGIHTHTILKNLHRRGHPSTPRDCGFICGQPPLLWKEKNFNSKRWANISSARRSMGRRDKGRALGGPASLQHIFPKKSLVIYKKANPRFNVFVVKILLEYFWFCGQIIFPLLCYLCISHHHRRFVTVPRWIFDVTDEDE